MQGMLREADLRDALVAAWTDEIRHEATRWYVDLGDVAGAHLTVWRKRLREASAEAERRWVKRQRAISMAVRRDVLSDPCTYCGDWATDVDHIVPVSRGGTRDRDNLASACSSCNADKLDFTPAEWREYRQKRGMSWPPLTRMERLAEAMVECRAKYPDAD